MTKAKNTQRALLASAFSLLLCVSMLIGTTFAWFTDSVTSGTNKIVAGNLDVELEYAVLDATGKIVRWEPVEDDTSLFDPDARWEPGYTQVVYLKVKNEGSLSLNYKLAVTIADEHKGTNKDDDPIILSEILKSGAVTDWDGTAYPTRAAARNAIEESGNLKDYSVTGGIKAGDPDRYIALVVYMPEEVGNEANHKSNIWNGAAIPSIDLDIRLIATQMMDESDSFGNDYDENAFQDVTTENPFADLTKNTFVITTEAELLKFADLVLNGNDFAGKTVKLGNDIALTQANWTPIGKATAPFKGTFDGANNTISGLNISETISTGEMDAFYGGLFGYVEDAKIENLTVEGNIHVTGTGNAMVSGFAAQTHGNTEFSNCVNNVNITVDVTGEAIATGIAMAEDHSQPLTATKCVNNGNITVNAEMMSVAGGIFGMYITSHEKYYPTIDNESKNNGTLTADFTGDLYVIFG